MSKYGIQIRGTGAVMGRSSYAQGGPAGTGRPARTGRPAGPREIERNKRLKEKDIIILKMVEEGPTNKHKSFKMQKGKKITDSDGNVEFKAKGGRAGYKSGKSVKKKGRRMNTSRMNRLEELGRVDSEKAYTSKGKRNLRDEKKRIVKEVAGK
tara:strand:- start:78 stop:536 length:459 start_codon:yes stop_codon:yes gene_type:complete